VVDHILLLLLDKLEEVAVVLLKQVMLVALVLQGRVILEAEIYLQLAVVAVVKEQQRLLVAEEVLIHTEQLVLLAV
tara:strand:+ start:209 stop:436 length:228 start_codon:yes stop_codon:yes gene_type:complete